MKRRRHKRKRNPSTGTTVAIAVATFTVAGVAGFMLASLGCAKLFATQAELGTGTGTYS